jgi:hypothetical protein
LPRLRQDCENVRAESLVPAFLLFHARSANKEQQHEKCYIYLKYTSTRPVVSLYLRVERSGTVGKWLSRG